MIQSTIETKASTAAVWALWKKAYNMEEKGRRGAFSYRILEVSEGSHFTILWKSIFVKLLFTHAVIKKPGGSQISYSVQFRGLFAWPMRYLLRSKVESNLALVLKSLSKELESGIKTASNGRRVP